MLQYRPQLKDNARQLHKNLTDSESLLWSHLRRKQLMNVQFYRQKPIGDYVIDFFAPRAKLVIEVDGSQHREAEHQKCDAVRDAYLSGLGLKVLRFNSREVLTETDSVVRVIYREIAVRLNFGEVP